MYTPHREDPIYPARGIKVCWRDHNINAHREDFQPTWLVVLELLGTLNTSPTRYYTTPNDFFKLADLF